MSNPETSLVWHPLQGRLKDLRMMALANEERPPHWFRTEVRSQRGFPDLWWAWGASGTIELKHRHRPPAGDDTPCVIESISAEQRLFWRQAAEAGSSIHVLTRVANEWFLHDGDWARQWLGKVPLTLLRSASMFNPAGEDRDTYKCTELPDARTVLLLCGAQP